MLTVAEWIGVRDKFDGALCDEMDIVRVLICSEDDLVLLIDVLCQAW